MPSRRTLLTGTAAATATALAGCSGDDGLRPSVQDERPWPPDDATIVATAEEFLDADHPNGAFRLRSRVSEHVDDTGARRLFLWSDHGLVPGENQHANNGWRLAELSVEHDYAQAAPSVDARTSFRPAEDGESAPVRFGRSAADANDFAHGWRLRFGDSGDATWGATFLTELAPDTTFSEGDLVATVGGHVRTAKSWSLREYGTEQAVELRYGEDRRA